MGLFWKIFFTIVFFGFAIIILVFQIINYIKLKRKK